MKNGPILFSIFWNEFIKIEHFMLSMFQILWNIYKKNVKFKIGFTIILVMLVLGFILSLFAPMDTTRWHVVPKEQPPSATHLLGTTSMGRDVFWELCSSIKNSLIIATTTALISVHIGLVVGIIAGMKGGLLDRILMFITDTFAVIPGLPLLIVIIAVLKEWITMVSLGTLISLIAWPFSSRQVRAIVLSLRERAFIYTAKLSGMNLFKMILQEIMPHLFGWHLINFTNTVLFSIGFEAGLAMLGLSLLNQNTLGVMIYWALNQYYAMFRGIWWWIGAPLVTLIFIFIALYLISAGLSEYLMPQREG
jgi:peptide/nickel transport system permease protein